MRHRVVVLCASLAVAFAVYAAESGPFTPAQRNFWSLVPLTDPQPPSDFGELQPLPGISSDNMTMESPILSSACDIFPPGPSIRMICCAPNARL